MIENKLFKYINHVKIIYIVGVDVEYNLPDINLFMYRFFYM